MAEPCAPEWEFFGSLRKSAFAVPILSPFWGLPLRCLLVSGPRSVGAGRFDARNIAQRQPPCNTRSPDFWGERPNIFVIIDLFDAKYYTVLMPNTSPVRFDATMTLRMDAELVDAVEELRRAISPLPSKSDAIRKAVLDARAALRKPKARQK
jgi:hypothetical protein